MNRFDPILCSNLNEWLLTNVKRSVMIPHINPDGDALGSALGLNKILQNMGIDSVIISPGDYPSYLDWFGRNAKILIYENSKKVCEKLIKEADVLFFLDFNDIKRLGKLADFIGMMINQNYWF